MRLTSHRFWPVFILIWMAKPAQTQNVLTSKSGSANLEASQLLESTVLSFRESGDGADTTKATLRVRVLEKGVGNEPVQGATVLLKREDDKMLGRVTAPDGKCLFQSSPASYTVRVQMTGLKTLEKTGILLEGGTVYELEIRMARN